MWRQGMFVIPFMTRLGITNSWGLEYHRGTITNPVFGVTKVWPEHILCFLDCAFSSYRHWVYWDLEIFCDERTENLLWICQDFWNSFISLVVGLLWFWCISCNRIVWSEYGYPILMD
ncbi:hypothetical protein IC575_014495 [Cucumis melo]